MSVKTGQTVVPLFSVSSATGAAVDADALPVGTLYVNGTADAAEVTVTKISTGKYKASVVMPTLAKGDTVSLSIAATIATVACEGIVWQDIADTKLVGDLKDFDHDAEGVGIWSVQGVAVTSIEDFKADVSDLPTNSELEAAITGLSHVDSAQDLTALTAAVEAIPTTPLLAADYVAPDNVSIAAILVDTGTDGVVVADGSKTGYALSSTGVTAVMEAIRDLAGYGLIAIRTLLTTTGIKVATNADKTGYSGTATNMVGEAPTAAANASAVRTELTTELARLDVAVGTRNATAPDNAGIASILTAVTTVRKWFTNRRAVTESQQVLYDDDGTSVIATQPLSDDGTTAERGTAV